MKTKGTAALLVALSLVAAPLPAQEGDAGKEARSHFERGLELFREDALDAALAEFRRSIELYPTRSASRNLAVTLRGLKRFDEAESAFQSLLRAYPNLGAEERASVERDLADLAGKVGQVVVRASEPGATVVLDGLERGRAPLPGPLRVSSGTHVIRVYKDGFVPYETRIEVVGRGSVTVEARLTALAQGGRLAVVAGQGGVARVVVDDVVVGTAPWEGTLSVGRHAVALRADGQNGSPPASVEIRANERTKLSLLVEPLECRVRVEPTPATAIVAVDGVEVGRGIWQGDLRCGGHLLEIADEGFITLRKSVALTKEHGVTVRESLERDPTSDAFRRTNPPRVTLDVRALFLLGLTLGGPPADGCTGACSASLPYGGGAMARGGYKLGVGLGFALDAGYLAVRTSLRWARIGSAGPGAAVSRRSG